MKDNFRGASKSSNVPPEVTVRPPDPEYIYDVSLFSFFVEFKTYLCLKYLLKQCFLSLWEEMYVSIFYFFILDSSSWKE